MKKFRKILSVFSALALIWGQILAPSLILAQEATSSSTLVVDVSSTPQPTPTSSSSPEASPSATPTPTPTPQLSPNPSPALSDWTAVSDNTASTTNNVVLDHLYQAPQNSKVTLKFNKLPENPGKLTIKEITLSDEQIAETGALSKTAYDISSTMPNGTFEYTLTLPTPKTDNVEVKASEDGKSFVTLGGVSAQTDTLTITGLNHFTIFVVTATGGESIPGSTAGGAFTTLTGPSVAEKAANDISCSGPCGGGGKTIILSLPLGFEFDTGSSVTATVTGALSRGGACTGNDKPLLLNGTSSEVVLPTESSITFHLTKESQGNCRSTISWSGIKVRPTSGTPLASGNITISSSSTAALNGITLNSTNLGSLTEVAGAVSASISTVSASPTSVLANGTATSTVTVTLKDSNSNPVSGKTVTLVSSRGATDTISAASGTSNASGLVTFTIKSSTIGASTFTATNTTDGVTITQTALVNFTNVPPSFDAIADQSINEDASAQNVSITNVSPGPADEAGQTVTFTATTSHESCERARTRTDCRNDQLLAHEYMCI